MKKITVDNLGIVHYHAMCFACDFTAAIQTPETKTTADVIQSVRRHVRTTGHTVSVESGSVTRYSCAQENNGGHQ